jgi:membrane-associated protease RseP (regulator of RpoE activity)
MSQNREVQTPPAPAQSVITCVNCHSAMPSELRFCRNCGFRLGEGVAEYTPTVRFDGTTVPAMSASGAPATIKKKKRMSGMAWIFMALLFFFVGAAALTALITPSRTARGIAGVTAPAQPKSFLGVDDFETVDDGLGVTFDAVTAPGTPADKAGLVGGDIITSFDGHAVHDDDQMRDLMTSTPIGKTVEIEYLRDGDKKTTKLTTISSEENRRLSNLFEKRPEGRGSFGYESGAVEQVEIPGTKIVGVKLNKILTSRPADLAGIKDGDIIITFDNTPIRTKDEFLMRVRRVIPYSTVDVEVMRGEGENLEKLVIPVKLGKQG